MKRAKKPAPIDATDMLSGMYSWAGDKKNEVVSSLNAELKRLKKGVTAANQWEETELVQLEQECLRALVDVDVDGVPNHDIRFITEDDGRQRISFLLKTIRSHEESPQASKFTNCNEC